MFQKGQTVYVGYSPKADKGCSKFLGSIGTIVGGPFQPTDWSGDERPMPGIWYHVIVEGQEFAAVARILFPFDSNEDEQFSDSEEMESS